MESNFENVIKLSEELWQASWSHWIKDDFLAWHWWINLAMTIVPWFIWVRVVDKKRLKELLLYGCFVSIFSIWLDALGSSMVL